MRLRKDLQDKAASGYYMRSKCPQCIRGGFATTIARAGPSGMYHSCPSCHYMQRTTYGDIDDPRTKVEVLRGSNWESP